MIALDIADTMMTHFFLSRPTRMSQLSQPAQLRVTNAFRTRPFPRMSSILEDTTTISFETIFNAEKRIADGGMDISFDEFYRVILHYSGWTEDKLVTQKVVQAVPALTYSEALRVVQNAHSFGNAIVKTLPLDEAVLIRANLTRHGLKATIELA